MENLVNINRLNIDYHVSLGETLLASPNRVMLGSLFLNIVYHSCNSVVIKGNMVM